MNDRDYDNWKLASPYENDICLGDYDATETDKYKYFSCNYEDVIKFDLEMIEAEKMGFDGFDSQGEFLEDYAENLADELCLYEKEEDAIEVFLIQKWDDEQAKKEGAQEQKAEWAREARLLRDE
jgi:hypothetical protein